MAPYIQHNLEMNGKYFYDNWYLPSTQGVVVRMGRAQESGADIGQDWVRDPTAGWMAVRDRQTDRGLLFVFDYNLSDALDGAVREMLDPLCTVETLEPPEGKVKADYWNSATDPHWNPDGTAWYASCIVEVVLKRLQTQTLDIQEAG